MLELPKETVEEVRARVVGHAPDGSAQVPNADDPPEFGLGPDPTVWVAGTWDDDPAEYALIEVGVTGSGAALEVDADDAVPVFLRFMYGGEYVVRSVGSLRLY